MTRWLARGLAIAAVAWCIALGAWIWITPFGTRSFAEVSAFGPAPLLLPVSITALGAWAVWRRRLPAAAVATGVLLLFVVLAGFSIGTGYLPAAAALVWAFIARAES